MSWLWWVSAPAWAWISDPVVDPPCVTAPVVPVPVFQHEHVRTDGLFAIRWTDEEAPPPDCGAASDDVACFAGIPELDTDAPNFVDVLYEDLVAARASLVQNQYPVASGRTEVWVHLTPYSTELGFFGHADWRSNRIHLVNEITDPGELALQAAHQLFHLTQFAALDAPEPWSASTVAEVNHSRWVLEASAEYFARMFTGYLLSPQVPGSPLFGACYIDGSGDDWVVFQYFDDGDLHDGILAKLFGGVSPGFHVGDLPDPTTTSGFEIFARELRERYGSAAERADQWARFVYALYFSRDDALFPRVSEILPEGLPLPTVRGPTGFERPDPGCYDEEPKPLPAVEHLSATTSAVVAFDLDQATCATAGDKLPDGRACNGPNAIPVPAEAEVVVDVDLPEHTTGAVWKAHVSNGGVVSSEQLTLIADESGQRTYRYPFDTFAFGDQIVVALVADPDPALLADGTASVSVAFESCRADRIVIDHDGPNWGSFEDLVVSPGCVELQAKLWGGGGGLQWPELVLPNGDGGGGGAVVGIVPVDPAGETLKTVVTFDGHGPGVGGGLTMLAEADGTPILLAGGGGAAGRGTILGGWVNTLPPDGGAAEQDAPTAEWWHPLYGYLTCDGGTAATFTGPGLGGAPNNLVRGDGHPWNYGWHLFWSSGLGSHAFSGHGGAGWYGGGGGGFIPAEWYWGRGAGGGGGSNGYVTTRLDRWVNVASFGGDHRNPGRVDDPDRTTNPAPPDVLCDAYGVVVPGDPGRGRVGTAIYEYCDSPGRIVIRTGGAMHGARDRCTTDDADAVDADPAP